jgi:hypothetical protein
VTTGRLPSALTSDLSVCTFKVGATGLFVTSTAAQPGCWRFQWRRNLAVGGFNDGSTWLGVLLSGGETIADALTNHGRRRRTRRSLPLRRVAGRAIRSFGLEGKVSAEISKNFRSRWILRALACVGGPASGRRRAGGTHAAPDSTPDPRVLGALEPRGLKNSALPNGGGRGCCNRFYMQFAGPTSGERKTRRERRFRYPSRRSQPIG